MQVRPMPVIPNQGDSMATPRKLALFEGLAPNLTDDASGIDATRTAAYAETPVAGARIALMSALRPRIGTNRQRSYQIG
jgi:hypothetical protein